MGFEKNIMCVDEALRKMHKGQKVMLTCPLAKMVYVNGSTIKDDIEPSIFELELGDFMTEE